MPELPEVEVTRRALAPVVEGHTVSAVVVREPRLRWPVPPRLAAAVTGHAVHRLRRRGKYLLWEFDAGTLVSHLGMSGSWRIHHADRAPPPGPHDHVDIVIGVHLLRLTDPRRFGGMFWHRADRGAVERDPRLARLGVEPFDPRFGGAWLHRFTRGRRAPIKQLLLAGEAVVGVGNIYASESLFRARIHPRTPAQRLGPARCERLAAAIRAVLDAAIAAGGSSLRDFHGGDGSEGYFTAEAQVYGREGQPCVACGRPVRRIVQGQRATFYCPACQRA
ncbi:MAG TPA: bifunctional DNA-formamidopyrimidine glycosylase/DNA-(apurinic or apyrimidinic site) lyase [Burkholderiaceae bacterium]|nr:bifunctional DNA-formamidopyrimidine glycosylase/DNA-(apurinic or apyrimidinic site) lyase [Burkholderiaceae bacterium]